VELDSEKGPQLRVREGQEHAAFLALWSGNMIIHRSDLRVHHALLSSSVVDLDPPGSAFIWLSWIQIWSVLGMRIRIQEHGNWHKFKK
jgi:hypothetical protein